MASQVTAQESILALLAIFISKTASPIYIV